MLSRECSAAKPKRIAEIPRDRILAVFDADGTLTRPRNELVIQRFLTDVPIGSGDARASLEVEFKKWSEARDKGLNPDYEHYLTQVGNGWARLLSSGGYNPKQAEIMEITERWFKQYGSLEVMDYSQEVIIETIRRKVRPVLVTGAPFEIAYHLGRQIGVSDVIGMEVEMSADGRYRDFVRHNTGLPTAKAKVCERMGLLGHKIIFAMGDTHADNELFKAAIGLIGRHDVNGRAILINPTPQNNEECRRWNAGWIANHDLEILKQHSGKDAVIDAVIVQLERAFERNGIKDGQLDEAA